MITSYKLELICWSAFFAFIVYYVVFRSPSPSKVYSSSSDEDVNKMKSYLAENGIKTYIKSRSPYRLKTYGGLADPSLHVMDPKDREKALQLIENSIGNIRT